MGIPTFYRWLSDKYPLIVVNAIEEEPVEIGGIKIPVDTSKKNPNSVEYDNLYLDMNGIIHPCFHPEDGPSPTTFDEVFESIFDYIDKVFVMVRPRKLLYVAIDGVAPRAKMNQQRSRRFRSAKDAAEAVAEEARLREEFEREGKVLLPKEESQVVDFNVITPGTEFMDVLSTALQYFIHLRLNNDPGWKNVKVILSDANVPGEGEHKVMSYIRLQRSLEGYDPNTRHCLYGSDADLILLAMATHEIHFSIIREVVFTPGQDKCCVCGQIGHTASNCRGNAKSKAGEFDDKGGSVTVAKKPFQFLNIWTLRDYLEYEMRIPNLPFEIDLECIVDDFIFICLFVGNDFLPHLPTLEIREGALNLLMAVYKQELQTLGGYLTDGCKPNLSRVERFIQTVGSYETRIFQKRASLHQRLLERIRREMAQANGEDDVEPVFRPESLPSPLVAVSGFLGSRLATGPTSSQYEQSGSTGKQSSCNPSNDARISSLASVGAAIVEVENSLKIMAIENKNEFKTKLKKKIRDKSDVFNSKNPVEDKIKLGEPGWKERYYEEKFSAKSREELEMIRKDVVLKYTEGLCWVMNYYYEGVCSWQWFYPYHYAPFASDLRSLGKLKISFELGSPFNPFNQLLAVCPAASANALPQEYRKLMTDSNSPIIDFYPTDFEVDVNGKRYAWQGIAKLPFIDESRLLAEVKKIEHSLTEVEVRRNSVTFDVLFINSSHPLSASIRSLYSKCKKLSARDLCEVKVPISPIESTGMNGFISPCSGEPCPPVFRSPVSCMENIMDNHVICAIYKLPDAHRHIPRPPEGVQYPEKTVTIRDVKPEPVLWHEDPGRRQMDNRREHQSKSNSGHRLGHAALQLIANTLDLKVNSNGHNNAMNAPAQSNTRLDLRPPLVHPHPVPNLGHRQDSRGMPLRFADTPSPVQTQFLSSGRSRQGVDNQPYPRSLGNPNYELLKYEKNNHSLHSSRERNHQSSKPDQKPWSASSAGHVDQFRGFGGRSYQSSYGSNQNFHPRGSSYSQGSRSSGSHANHSAPKSYDQPQYSGNRNSGFDNSANGKMQAPSAHQGYGR